MTSEKAGVPEQGTPLHDSFEFNNYWKTVAFLNENRDYDDTLEPLASAVDFIDQDDAEYAASAEDY